MGGKKVATKPPTTTAVKKAPVKATTAAKSPTTVKTDEKPVQKA